MFSKLRNRHSAAMPIAVLALIVAVAFAGVPAMAAPVANSSANLFSLVKRALKVAGIANKRSAIANKRSINAIKIARTAEGQQGEQGPQGPKGDKGDRGPAGEDGDNGAKGATGPEGPQGPPGEDGEDGEPGPEGSPWTAGGVLPSGSTQTGAFAFSGLFPASGLSNHAFGQLTFPIPLPGALSAENVHAVNTAGEELNESFEFEPATICLGSVAEPTAPDGKLCVYLGTAKGFFGPPGAEAGFPEIILLDGNSVGANTAGARLRFTKVAEGYGSASGSFAVTAP